MSTSEELAEVVADLEYHQEQLRAHRGLCEHHRGRIIALRRRKLELEAGVATGDALGQASAIAAAAWSRMEE